jgi:3-oxoadipate enol-lactonase
LPFIDLNAGEIHYRFDGPMDRPVVMLSNSLGTDLSMWDPQMPALSPHFRTLRYDNRGQGRSAVPAGPYTIEELGRDVIELLDKLEIKQAHFCGLSMGGMIGIWLGAHGAYHLHKLVLCNTAARIGTREMWNARIEAVRAGGLESIATSSIGRWFTGAFATNSPDVVDTARQMLMRSPADGFIASCEGIRDANLIDDAARVAVPTMVISGSQDPAATPADGRALAQKIAGAHYVELNSAHLSNIEVAQQFSNSLLQFLQ